MTASPPRGALRAATPAVAVVLLLLGVYVVREATQSRHHAMPPDSRVRVVIAPRSKSSEPSQAVDDVLMAHLRFCQLEVGSRIQGGLEPLSTDPARFAVVMAPALDPTDRKQFRGCVEDWVVDNHLVDVVSMEDLDAP